MSQYQHKTFEAEQYTRACKIEIYNPLEGSKLAAFTEEDIITLDGTTINRPKGQLVEHFNETTSLNEFPLLNPETGEPLGATAKYQDLYVLLHSLYFHLATKRDTPQND